uniref:PH domain-containing protein n=1 Tax=Macrostomum lignano TaxID=282301 RepID=A0A1I8JPJ2_9PLAT
MGGGLGLGLGSRRMSRRGSFTTSGDKQHRRKVLGQFCWLVASNTTEQQNEWLKASLKGCAENGYTWLLNDAYTTAARERSTNNFDGRISQSLQALFIYVLALPAHQDSLLDNLGECRTRTAAETISRASCVRYIRRGRLTGMSLFDAMERDFSAHRSRSCGCQDLQINSDFLSLHRRHRQIRLPTAKRRRAKYVGSTTSDCVLYAAITGEIMAKTHFLPTAQRSLDNREPEMRWLRQVYTAHPTWLTQLRPRRKRFASSRRCLPMADRPEKGRLAAFGKRLRPPFSNAGPGIHLQEVVGSFEAALSMGKILLVKRLAWLPAACRPAGRIVASTLSSDLTCASLSRRSDVQIYRFGATADTGAEMMANFSADFGQTPGDDFWEAFVESPLAPSCPLAQSAACAGVTWCPFVSCFYNLLRRWSSEYGWVKLTLMEKSDQTQKSLFEKEESQIKHGNFPL